MSNDLIAWIVVITLGAVVVVLGLRRNLSEITRNGLPRFDRASEQATAIPGPPGYGQWRRPLTQRQWRWGAGVYLLLGLGNAATAVMQADSRLIHAISAATFAFGAVVVLLRKPRSSLDASIS
jgi:hypothetical protein